MDYPSLIKECSRGWSPCKSELLSQLAGPVGEACSKGNTPECRKAARHEALKRLAQDQGWPDGTVVLAENCLDGDEKACAKLSAYIGAQAACMYFSGGACSMCCGKLVGPLVELIWPVLGPFVEGIVGIVIDLGTLALESIGLKDTPTASDWAGPMKLEAEKRSSEFVEQWLKAVGPDDTPSIIMDMDPNIVDAAVEAMGTMSGSDWFPGPGNWYPEPDKASSIRRPPQLVDSIRVAPPMQKFKIEPYVNLDWTPLDCLEIALRSWPGGGWYKELWMPTNWGNISLPAETAPFGWKVDLEFNKLARGEAYEVASKRMAKMYETRLRVLSGAAAQATGMVAAVRQARTERDQATSRSSIWPWLILATAIGAGAYAWRQSK